MCLLPFQEIMFCFPLFMCSLWEIHILEESTKQYSKVSQKGYGACGQTCYTAQQAGSRIMVLNILHMIKNLKALFRETGHFLSHTQDLRLMTHPEPVRTQSDCDSRGSIFFSTYITHLVPLEPRSQFCHLPGGSKFHVSRALNTQGRLGTQLGFFVTQLWLMSQGWSLPFILCILDDINIRRGRQMSRKQCWKWWGRAVFWTQTHPHYTLGGAPSWR